MCLQWNILRLDLASLSICQAAMSLYELVVLGSTARGKRGVCQGEGLHLLV